MSIFANAIAPSAYFWPGVLPLMLGMAFPATVLAAVIERPFVTRAGVTKHALWYSLQANLLIRAGVDGDVFAPRLNAGALEEQLLQISRMHRRHVLVPGQRSAIA